jgi:peptidyl-prolyl cis-trans isomerase D
VLRPVLSADTSKLPAFVGMPIADGGYLLVRISKVTQGNLKQEQASQATERVASLMGAAQYEAYVASLRQHADIELNQKNLERK